MGRDPSDQQSPQRWPPWLFNLVSLVLVVGSVVWSASQIAARITTLDERFTAQAGRIAAAESRLSAIESSFQEMRVIDTTQSNDIKQLADVQARLRQQELALGRIEGTMAAGFERQKDSLDRFLVSLQGVREEVTAAKKQLAELAGRMQYQQPRGRE